MTRTKSEVGERSPASSVHSDSVGPIKGLRASEFSPVQHTLRLQAIAGNAAVRGVLGGGEPLPKQLREDMEARFGTSFDKVRVHTDKQTASAINANAYTSGNDIVFNEGRFDPSSAKGQRLLAHELAHVMQQRRGGPKPTGDANEPNELEASRVANDYHGGTGRLHVDGAAAVGIAREEPLSPPKTIEEYEERFGKIERVETGDLSRKQKEKIARDTRNNRLHQIPVAEERAARLEQERAERGIAKADDPTPLNTRSWKEQGRDDRQGALRRLAFEEDPAIVPPAVASDLRDQLKKLEKVMAEGRYDESKHEHALKLPKGYVLGHWEGNEFLADTPETPAREGFDYNNSRVITKEENDAEEALRKRKAGLKTKGSKKTAKPPPEAVPPVIRKKANDGVAGTDGPIKPTPVAEVVEPPLTLTAPTEKRLIAVEKPTPPNSEFKALQRPSPELPGTAKLTTARVETPKAPAGESPPTKVTPQPRFRKVPHSEAPLRPLPSLSSAALEETHIERFQTRGAVLGFGMGLLTGFALEKYREWMRDSLAAVPPIEIGTEPLNEYLKSSPGATQVSGLLSKDIDGFALSLEQNGRALLLDAAGRTLNVGLATFSQDKRIEQLRDIGDGVDAFLSDLTQAQRGIDQALQLETVGHERIAAAESLADMILSKKPNRANGLVWDWLVKQGFSIEEILQMHANLRKYASDIGGLFRRLHLLSESAGRIRAETINFSSRLNGIFWSEVWAQAREKQAEK